MPVSNANNNLKLLVISKLHFELTSLIRQYPAWYFPLMEVNKNIRRIPGGPLVTRHTELVIEGFFRCGNTFAAIAFVQCQKRRVIIANHSHAPASVIKATKLGIPTLVLIREPRETVLSLAFKHPHVSLRQGLRAYIRYHENICPYRPDFVLATFSQVTGDYGQVIESVNRRFGTDFVPFNHTGDSVRRVFDRIETADRKATSGDLTRYSIPNAEKELAKSTLSRELTSKKLQPLIKQAEEVYQEFATGKVAPALLESNEAQT